MVSPIFRLLKEEGYHTTAYLSENCITVLKMNPYIDELKHHVKGTVKPEELGDHIKKISEGFDRVINLSESIEVALLKPEGYDEFLWPKDKRHEQCNKNYYDYTLEKSGIDEKGLNGELYFTKNEHRKVKKKLMKYKDKYIVLWSLSGSAYHKVYPYAEYVACEFLERHPDVVVITVGDTACTLLEWEHPRTINKSDKWNIREVMLMTKYVDMVIGTETGILNASGCYNTDKVVLLSHSSKENLTKYWKNCISLNAETPCYPCHQLHYKLESCPLGDLYAPRCVEDLKPIEVLNAMESVYVNNRRMVA